MKLKKLWIIEKSVIVLNIEYTGRGSTEDTWETTSTMSKAGDSIKNYLDSLNEQQIHYVHSINNNCNRSHGVKIEQDDQNIVNHT